MNLNKHQKIILWIGIFIFVLLNIFSPTMNFLLRTSAIIGSVITGLLLAPLTRKVLIIIISIFVIVFVFILIAVIIEYETGTFFFLRFD